MLHAYITPPLYNHNPGLVALPDQLRLVETHITPANGSRRGSVESMTGGGHG
jgi:hypothetical protein